MAVTGLPEPQEDHAILMVKFAHDCRTRNVQLFRKLEATLGPGTSQLNMRFGLHSGPTTAGVLRGEKSRFQLVSVHATNSDAFLHRFAVR